MPLLDDVEALLAGDVVEVCPAADHNGITSLLAATLIFEGLALLALRC